MAYAPLHADSREILGQFTEVDNGCVFEFSRNSFEAGFPYTEANWPHVVWVGPEGQSRRFARVLKTVVYVVVDEDMDGPVVEKWNIKRWMQYQR